MNADYFSEFEPIPIPVVNHVEYADTSEGFIY